MDQTNARQRAKWVERWKDSGLTAKEFAAEAGLKASALHYWPVAAVACMPAVLETPPNAAMAPRSASWVSVNALGGTRARLRPIGAMIPVNVRIFVGVEPVDMRGGFDRLALLARDKLQQDPRSGALLIFTGRRRDRLNDVGP